METLRKAVRIGEWKRIMALPHMRAIAVMVMIVVPGGFMVPACYAAYIALRRSGSR